MGQFIRIKEKQDAFVTTMKDGDTVTFQVPMVISGIDADGTAKILFENRDGVLVFKKCEGGIQGIT